MDELAFATIRELGAALTARRFSSRELTRVALDRLADIGPSYNAVAALMPDRALAEAGRADRRRARAARAGRAVPPLLGIPYGAKDLLAAAGAPTRYGSAAFEEQVLDEDATTIRRLRRNGAVLAAKLAMMELAGFHGTRPSASANGPGRNPWDPDRWAAGSSNGSAVAVAAGLVPFALASETGGSIGSPSAYCGVTGIRPTFGAVSRYGAMTLARSLDKIGAIAHTADDLGLVLDAIGGPDGRDPATGGRHSRASDGAAMRPPGRDTPRMGWSPFDIEIAAEAAIRPALRDGLRVLQELGLHSVEVALPPDIPYLASLTTIIGAEGGAAFRELIESDRLGFLADPAQRQRLRESLTIPAHQYLLALDDRDRTVAACRTLFRRVDVLVSYTLPTPPTPIDEEFRTAPMEGGLSALVAASNLCGLPALFLPCGLTATGLPVGLQVVGPPWSEVRLLSIGRAFQAASDWHRLRPPVPAS